MTSALLLSGGMDSTAIASWLRPELAVFVDYGQRPAVAERRAATAVCKALSIPLEMIDIDCSALGSGLLAGSEPLSEAPTPEWWPFRNQLLVTIAAAAALRRNIGVTEVLVGSVAEDRLNGDGSPAFVAALDALLRVQEGAIGLRAPAIDMSSAQLIVTSAVPPEILGWTHSCFVSDTPCLRCRGCAKHLAVLSQTQRRWPQPSEPP